MNQAKQSAPINKPATALPWRVNGSETTTAVLVEDAEGKRVATIAPSEQDADQAAYICHAGNNYPDLVGLLKRALHNAEIQNDYSDRGNATAQRIHRECAAARKFLAKLGEA